MNKVCIRISKRNIVIFFGFAIISTYFFLCWVVLRTQDSTSHKEGQILPSEPFVASLTLRDSVALPISRTGGSYSDKRTPLHSNEAGNNNSSQGIINPPGANRTFVNKTGTLLKKADEHKITYLTVKQEGRLGNLMFQFASMLGTARLHGVKPAITNTSELRRIFEIDVPSMDWKTASGFARIKDTKNAAFQRLVGNFSKNQTMHGYFQSWRYFSNIYPELRKHFTFKKDLIKRATTRLNQLMREQHGNISLRNTTFVGVHIRRSDFTTAAKIKFGNTVGSKQYVFQAMHYFLTKYQRVMFVVCSDGMDWANKTIPHQNATFITKQTAELDMLTLSLCNHTIVTVGTFGWWAAWLAGGTTIYQIQQAIPGSRLSSVINMTDYIPPGWIGMNQTSATSQTTSIPK